MNSLLDKDGATRGTRHTPRSKRTAGLFHALLGCLILWSGLQAQTTYTGAWYETSTADVGRVGTPNIVSPGISLNLSIKPVQDKDREVNGGWRGYGVPLNSPVGMERYYLDYYYVKIGDVDYTRGNISYDNHWLNPLVWGNNVPDANTDARIVESHVGDTPIHLEPTIAIELPTAIQGAAVARSLTVLDVVNDPFTSQQVTLRNGTLNLTPASVFDTALTVGVASIDGASSVTNLRLENVTLSSSGLTAIGKGLPIGSGGGELQSDLRLVDSSRWLHQAGLIEIGGGGGNALLSVGNDSLLAGSLFPGVGLDPRVQVNTSSTLEIAVGGTARLSEISVESRGMMNAGLMVYSSFETNRLIVGDISRGKVELYNNSVSRLGDTTLGGNSEINLYGATAQADSLVVRQGQLLISESVQNTSSQLTIGTPNPNDPNIERLVLAKDTGAIANLTVTNSTVTVHSNALLGGYGQATVNIEQGGMLDIRGKAYLGQSEDMRNGAAGSGTVSVTGAGSVLRAQYLEMGYNYGEYRGTPSPAGNLSVGSGGRVEIAGKTEYNTSHFGGNLINGKGGTIDFVDGTGKIVFTDPSNGGHLSDKPQLINTGTIKGGGTGPGPEAQIDFGSTGGTLVNKGTIDVGHSPGWLTVNGDVSFGGMGSYNGNGRLKIELSGTNAGLDYDVLEVWGNADFTGGTLELSFLDGYTPLAGDYWDFLRVSGSVTGWFSSFVIPQGYESYLTALQDWNGESNFRLYADDSSGGSGGGGSSVPDGGATGLLLTVSFLGLMLVRSRESSTRPCP